MDTNRMLTAMDDDNSYIPFSYEADALSTIRPDQFPRFMGAVTGAADLPTKSFKFSELTAMQNRVSHGKVAAMREKPETGGHPVVVTHAGKNYIADGHHRAAARWLDGGDELVAHHKDITEFDNAVKVAKVNEELGIVIGWAIISKIAGEPYYDTQGDHIPEDEVIKSLAAFMQDGKNVAKDMHAGADIGRIVFAFPMTSEIAKSLGIETHFTGLIIGAKPDSPEILEKYRSGAYTGFSIGGRANHDRT